MIGHVAQLVRHPVKSGGYELVADATLTPDTAFPFDRVWAIAHAGARLAEPPGWAPKLQFLRGWGAAELMAIACTSDPTTATVTLSHPRLATQTFRPDDPQDAARLIAWIAPLWPDARPEPARVVRVPGRAMTDVEPPYISINSRASLADLAARIGQDLSIHRFRGNIWVEGWAPWADHDLIGREVAIGEAVLRVEKVIARCRATEANPDTGAQDADVMTALQSLGHTNFGIYARVLRGGRVRPGDRVAA